MVKNTRTPHLAGGAFLAMLAAALLAVGGLALWADSRKDADGYLATDAHRFAAASHALATADLDFDGLDGALTAGDDAGRVRFTADSAHRKPVFVGIAHARREGLPPRRRPRHGDRRVDLALPAAVRPPPRRSPVAAGAPAGAASAQGAGRQAVQWDAKDGSWSVVVMNADGSAGVAADVDAGAKAPFLRAAGWGAIGAALLPLLAAGWLVGRGAPR